MNHETLSLLFMGAVWTVFLLNAVQWGLYRQRIYGLFTLHTFVWLFFFFARDVLPPGTLRDLLMVLALGASRINYLELVYALFARPATAARLRRWVRTGQGLVVGYLVAEVLFSLFPGAREQTAYAVLNALLRAVSVLITFVGVYTASRHPGTVARFFFVGSLFLLVRGVVAMTLFVGLARSWMTDALYAFVNVAVQFGLMFELLCFTLCLIFLRRRQEVLQARQQAVTEQELAREREQRRRESLEAELAVRRLEGEKMAVQLRALQAQVNPHFLFNSLNTLSSLIDESPRQAGDFVDELSSVYRYLLRANRATDRENQLTTLRDELAFIQSYFHLLKTRHGGGLHLDLRVAERFQHHQLPPLTLQLLVENAVKHNVVLPDQPLTVRIFTDPAGQLVVENNLQRKPSRVLSNGVGLSNILTQYQLLGQAAPTVSDEAGRFAVALPLVEPLTQPQA